MKNLFSRQLLLPVAIVALTATAALAQPGNGGPTPITSVPVDGGASLLLASGVAYGLRRLRRKNKA